MSYSTTVEIMQLWLLTEYSLIKYLIVLIDMLIFKGYLLISPYNAELNVVDFKFKSHFRNFLYTFFKLLAFVNDQFHKHSSKSMRQNCQIDRA